MSGDNISADGNGTDESPRQNNVTRRRLIQVLGASGVAGVAGCSADTGQSAETPTEPATDTAIETAEELAKSATIGVEFDVTSDRWGPVYPYYTRVFEPLVWPTHELKAAPWLATDWKQTGDKTWEFEIREGVTFHNGESLDAEDVIASLKDLLSREVVQQWLHMKPEEQRKVDDMTVELKTTRRIPVFPGTIAHNFVFAHPKDTLYITPKDDQQSVIGTGPYKVKKQKPEQFLTVSAFDDYWQGSPKMEELTYRVLRDENTRALALKSGEIHVGMMLPDSQLESINNSDETYAITQESTSVFVANFNTASEPTADVKLRKALNYAVSQKEIVEGAVNGIGTPGRGPISEIVWWSAHDSLPTYGPDKAKAEDLVEQSAYEGETLTLFAVPREGPENLMTQIIQQSAKDVGVDIEIKMLEEGGLDERVQNGEGNLYIEEFGTNSAAPDYIIRGLYHRDGYGSDEAIIEALPEEFHSLVDKGFEATDSEAKKNAYVEAQQIMMDSAILIPLIYREYVVGHSKDVGKFDYPPMKYTTRWEKLERSK